MEKLDVRDCGEDKKRKKGEHLVQYNFGISLVV